ncbi:TetR family transcriptional regulator C-terminal domain-containing protein [Ruegeria sp. HKCCD8929]|uniref:TetR family transcriptional regulator C-terminal domain-containing protein n=1 Tax=Ruegeria sp. HKCCD8929 TaxID=2683006 RepID=UPI001489D0FD|nr:TetR family transcriptional regulator C-terminal domain-containing protein [Ruegeria sp. HKCCD8929]
MPEDRAPTRIQKKNRAAILEAALNVFSTHGFRGATVDQIATEAGLSKPNLLYYYRSKDAIYAALLERLLDTWLDPLRAIDPDGDPLQELLGYIRRKLEMSRDYPRESRLFANEIIRGAPHIHAVLSTDLKSLVDETAHLIRHWIAEGHIAEVNPYHLIFSIWSLTQHYADFDVQIRAVLGDAEPDPYPGASAYLDQIFTRLLTPPG